MSELVRMRLPDGHEIWARVEPESGPSDVAWRPTTPAAALDDLTDTIKAISTSTLDALTQLRPHHVSVEFGVELAVKSGKVISVLTEASGKASLKVTVAWNGAPEPAAGGEDDDSGPASSLPPS